MADPYPLDAPAELAPRDIAEAWRREAPGTPVDSIPVVTPVFRLAKLLADDRRRLLASEGIDGATLDLLSTLRRSGEPYTVSTRDLAERCLVTAGAISQRVARAERDGLVERNRPSGKTVWVRLTNAGHRLVESVVDRLLRRELALLDGLEPADRDRLATLLGSWLDDVRARVG